MRFISGIQPTGAIHIGNYFSMIKPMIELQYNIKTESTVETNFTSFNEVFLFIADYHTVNTTPSPDILRRNIIDMVVGCLACGLDYKKTIFFRQSDINFVSELAWILSCTTPVNLLKRCHGYKEKISNGIVPNAGLFYYPILMAADILLYDSDIVLVGKDQKQHVEMARDIAIRFNNLYGDVLKIPSPKILSDVAVVPGIDGRKMSKSYRNTINIFDTDDNIKKSIFSIITDSKTLDKPKNPDDCLLFSIYKLISTEKDINVMRDIYKSGNFKYKEIKEKLYHSFLHSFQNIRKLKDQLISDSDNIHNIIQFGRNRALKIASDVILRVKSAIGLSK